jgi:hypothetical protein
MGRKPKLNPHQIEEARQRLGVERFDTTREILVIMNGRQGFKRKACVTSAL